MKFLAVKGDLSGLVATGFVLLALIGLFGLRVDAAIEG